VIIARSLILLFVSLLFAPVASAQLVRVRFDGWFVTNSGPPDFRPWSEPAPFRIDAIFDSRIQPHTDPSLPHYFDVENWVIDHPQSLNTLHWQSAGSDWTVPISSMRWRTGPDLEINYAGGRIPVLTLRVDFDAGVPMERLPHPPFALAGGESDVGTLYGQYLLVGQYIQGAITHLEAAMVPVPEPTAFATCGALLLILGTFVRRRVVRDSTPAV